jgi:membrane protease YdiL (CAAX protease family)
MEKFIRSLNVGKSIVYFGGFGFLLWILTRWGIPTLEKYAGIETIFGWFILGGAGVFLPMIILTVYKTCKDGFCESMHAFFLRLRLAGFRIMDLFYILLGTALSGFFMWLIIFGTDKVGMPLTLHPSFMEFSGFSVGERWKLLYGIPLFIVNIFGEEMLWRGYILPRQVTAFGKSGWILNACLWFFFHSAFGFDLMVLMIPTLIIVPLFTYFRRNTWVGIGIHALINGPAFIGLALNLF